MADHGSGEPPAHACLECGSTDTTYLIPGLMDVCLICNPREECISCASKRCANFFDGRRHLCTRQTCGPNLKCADCGKAHLTTFNGTKARCDPCAKEHRVKQGVRSAQPDPTGVWYTSRMQLLGLCMHVSSMHVRSSYSGSVFDAECVDATSVKGTRKHNNPDRTGA